jgi:CheY-like chemotaxis protein
VSDAAESPRPAASALAQVRHELRTPLNAVIGYSEILLEDAQELDDPALVFALERVHDSARDVLGHLNDVLDPQRTQTEGLAAALQERLRAPLDELAESIEVLAPPAEARGFVQELETIRAAAARLTERIAGVEELAPAAGPAATPAPAPVERPARPEAAGTLLVVDDTEANRELLGRRLEREGYAVAYAEDGRRALEMLRARDFDLVLLDVMMPEIDGYEVLRVMKSDERLRHVPVLMISALDELESVVRCIELGAEDYLPKPFNPVLLRARIGACLEKKLLRDREVLHLRRIEDERRRADELLHVILPGEVVEELKATNAVKPRLYENVAVLFCDIVGFTPYCRERHPEEVIAALQGLVLVYEELALRHDLQKIKTVGDCFMATAGLLKPVENPALNAVRCGLEMVAIPPHLPPDWKVRVGVHVGPAIAGVVGHRQYLFDLWGDTVNTAARVESHGAEGCVNLSDSAWRQVADHCLGESLGMVPVKGKGEMELFRVTGLREERAGCGHAA